MQRDIRNDGPVNEAPEVANVGLARPPAIYAGATLIGLVLGALRPLPFLPAGFPAGVGSLLVVIGGALFVHSIRTFRAANWSSKRFARSL
jgi:hypothetical protein